MTVCFILNYFEKETVLSFSNPQSKFKYKYILTSNTGVKINFIPQGKLLNSVDQLKVLFDSVGRLKERESI